MTSLIGFKTFLLTLSQSLIQLCLRYLLVLVLGVVPLYAISLLAGLFIGGGTLGYIEIALDIFFLALPSILVWHVLNEAIRLSNFEVKYQEHITAFGVAIVMVVLSWWFINTSLDSIEFSILACLFIFFAVLNSYLYVMLYRRFLSNIGC